MFSVWNTTPPRTYAPAAAINLRGAGRSLCLVSTDGARFAKELVQAGWRVTLLDIAAQALSVADGDYATIHLTGQYQETNAYLPLRSLCVYHWLRAQTFDFVLFHCDFGAGYYSMVAKQLGLAFGQTNLVAMPVQPQAKRFEDAMQLPEGRTDIEYDYMETETVRRADGVVFPDDKMRDWMQRANWDLPAQTAMIHATGATSITDWLGAEPVTDMPDDVFISVCLATYNRPQMVLQAIQSLLAQTYRNFEVVLVDDGSTDPGMVLLRDELSQIFKQRNWQWVTQDNRGPSATRNRIMELGRGTHFLFMDDDNIAYPDELERFARAASTSDADILTCILGMHPESSGTFDPTAMLPERTGTDTRPVGWTPVGASLALSVFVNCFGDTNALFKRDVFTTLGGFRGSPAMVIEDFELLTRAVIAGYRLEVVPEVLMLYRRHAQSRSMGATIFTSHLESLKPLTDLLPPELHVLLLTLRRNWYERHCMRRDSIGG